MPNVMAALKCRARTGSVGIVNFRLGQRRLHVNMIGRSQQQRMHLHAQPARVCRPFRARLTADK